MCIFRSISKFPTHTVLREICTLQKVEVDPWKFLLKEKETLSQIPHGLVLKASLSAVLLW